MNIPFFFLFIFSICACFIEAEENVSPPEKESIAQEEVTLPAEDEEEVNEEVSLSEEDEEELNKEIALADHPKVPVSPFKTYISGTGIVEASSENISIGTSLNRVVDEVFVKVGQDVTRGQPLLQLENRDLQADLITQDAAYQVALAKIKRLESMPRPEDIMPAEAALRSAAIGLNQAQNQYEMTQGLQDTRAISQEEINRRYFNYQQAEANWQRAQADLNKIKAGIWKPDLEIAHLEAQQAKANVERIKTDMQRTTIRSPIDGKVLQVRIHPGEIPGIDTFRIPLMIVGNVTQKHLQVSINQFDASSFRPHAPAVAFLRGNAETSFPLEFVQLEPYLVNKHNLTHDITEKVDTRVLQVTYRFKENHPNIFVGQQMDVFIETDSKK